MLLHKSKFVEITLEEENSLIIDKFLPETYKMNIDEFKKEMFIFVEMCEKYCPKRELVYLMQMEFIISPDLQEWMNREIFPRYLNIIKRMAFLVPTEIVIQISVEQTMEEETGSKFLQAYFDSEIEARKWLMIEC